MVESTIDRYRFLFFFIILFFIKIEKQVNNKSTVMDTCAKWECQSRLLFSKAKTCIVGTQLKVDNSWSNQKQINQELIDKVPQMTP